MTCGFASGIRKQSRTRTPHLHLSFRPYVARDAIRSVLRRPHVVHKNETRLQGCVTSRVVYECYSPGGDTRYCNYRKKIDQSQREPCFNNTASEARAWCPVVLHVCHYLQEPDEWPFRFIPAFIVSVLFFINQL